MSTLLMAYAGQRLTAKDTLGHAWQPVHPDGSPDGDLHLYKKPLVRYAAIGAIYEFTLVDDEGTAVYSGGEHAPRKIGGLVDADTRLLWECKDRDDRTTREELQLAKREKDVSLLREQLLPIRVAMARKPSMTSRSAVANAVAQELWRPLTQAERQEAGL